MTDTPVSPHEGPRELLRTTRRLTRRVRRAQRGTWFPPLLFGVLALASVPIARYGSHAIDCRVSKPGRVCLAFSPGSYVYWPIALALAYAAITGFHLRRARSRGVGSRVRPYVIAGIVIALAATGISLWLVTHPGAVALPWAAASVGTGLMLRLVSPEGAIGLALLVLARVERNGALLVFGLAYLAVVSFGWLLAPRSPWPFAVIPAAMLLLGSAGFAIAERRAGLSSS